jgi:hypothetical protein
MMLNLATHKRVKRWNWEKMVTSDLVIVNMNALADKESQGQAPIPLFEDDVEERVDPVAVRQPAEEQPERLPIGAKAVGEVEQAEVPGIEVDQPAEENDAAVRDVPEFIDQQVILEDDDEEDQQEPIREQVAEPRRPERQSNRIAGGVRKPQRYIHHTSVRKSLAEHGKSAWDAAIAELKQPVMRKDLSPTKLKKVIRSLMFLKTMFDGLGRFEKIKARLCANGADQDRKLYENLSSPTAMMQSLLMVLTIGAREARKAAAMDIGGAYVEVIMTGEDVIMELDPLLANMLAKIAPEVIPYIDKKGKLLGKLDKALYGCVQSAKLWYDTLTEYLRSIGFVHNE